MSEQKEAFYWQLRFTTPRQGSRFGSSDGGPYRTVDQAWETSGRARESLEHEGKVVFARVVNAGKATEEEIARMEQLKNYQ